MIPTPGLQELLLIGVLALIVVGPKDLPLMMRKLGRMVGQAKNLAREFQSSLDELGRQAELEELRKEVESLKREATGDVDKELARAGREIDEAVKGKPKTIARPTGEDAGTGSKPGESEVDSAGESAAPGIEPAAPPAADKPRPAGPRIEPVAQPKAELKAEPRPAETADAADAKPD